MFDAHGSFETEINNRILSVKIQGPWNLETALKYERAISAVTTPLKGKPWAMTTDLNDWELYTPDCYPIIHALVNRTIESGLVREAVISPEKSVKRRPFQLERKQYPEYKRQFFTSFREARYWLYKEGFE